MKKIVLVFGLVVGYFMAYSQDETEVIRISDDLQLERISANCFIHVSYMNDPQFGRFTCNGVVFYDENEAVLLDSPGTDSLTKILISFLKDSLNLKVVGFAPNHWHQDCMGGLNCIHSAGIPSVAGIRTVHIAREKNLPVPSKEFRDSTVIPVGSKEVRLYYLGGAHSTDNIVAWIPSEKILFPGCMVKDIHSHYIGNTGDSDMKEWPATLEKILITFPEAEMVIPGHGSYGNTDLIRHTLDLLKEK